MRIALAQMNPILGDFAANVQNALGFAESAKQAGADLVVYPAYALTGAWADNMLDSNAFARDARRALESFAVSTPVPAVMGAVVPSVFGGGSLVAVYCADRTVTVLACDEIGSGDDALFAQCPISAFPTVFAGGLSVAVALDYQLSSGFDAQMLDGADLLVTCSAESFDGSAAEGETRHLARQVVGWAVDSGVALARVNLVGGADDAVFDGGTIVLSADGVVRAGGFRFDEALVLADVSSGGAIEQGLLAEPLSRDEADWAALVLATRDYVRKSGFSDVVLGLSGGIDSAVVATIAVDALGADRVSGLLMPGPFSSPGSVADARELAENLGIRATEIAISEPLSAFVAALGPACGGEVCGLAHENLQARIRGVYLMTVANASSALVLNTGNKSEAAMGYSTLHGDTVGAFAPLADVYKTRVFELARWRREQGASIPAASIEKAPSAELSPGQRDEDTLPRYDLLDQILALHIEGGLGVSEIVERGYDFDLAVDVLARVSAAEFKRQLEPLGPTITRADFGSGHVWPINNRWVDRG